MPTDVTIMCSLFELLTIDGENGLDVPRSFFGVRSFLSGFHYQQINFLLEKQQANVTTTQRAFQASGGAASMMEDNFRDDVG